MNSKILIIALVFASCMALAQESSTISSSSNTTTNSSSYFDFLKSNKDFDEGTIYKEIILENQDTLLITRTYGEHWFGLFAGPNASYVTGNIRWAANPLSIAPGEYPQEGRDPIVDYTPQRVNADYNFFPGLIYEYAPTDWQFGFALRIFPYETVTLTSEYILPEELATRENEKYIFRSRIPYTGFSPQITYKFSSLGFKLFAGADLFFSIGEDDTDIIRDYVTISGQPEISRIIDNLEDPPVRYGFNAGFEYEYLILDIIESVRVKFAPYVMAEYTSSYISDFGSTVSPVILRAGLAIKFGPDKSSEQIKKYVPKIRGKFTASFEQQKRVSFEGFIVREELVSSGLDYIIEPRIFTDITDEPKQVASVDLSESRISSAPEEEKPKINLKKGDKRVFTFDNLNSTAPERDLRNFLKDIAEWMKTNNSEIRIVGHASPDEDFEKQQEISLQRAQRARNYLLKEDINPNRVLADGASSLEPRVDNDTAENRKKNRRVEIIVVK